jgi:hypothetical protein
VYYGGERPISTFKPLQSQSGWARAALSKRYIFRVLDDLNLIQGYFAREADISHEAVATAPGADRDARMSSTTAPGADASTAADGQTKAEGLRQMGAVVERSNLWLAYERVMRNKGAAGVDGFAAADFKAWLQQHWASVRAALLAGDYMPRAIRKVEIPKPNGGGTHTGHPYGTGPRDPASAASSSATGIRT